jgi:uncharacterized protein YqcC (DUF446 family)
MERPYQELAKLTRLIEEEMRLIGIWSEEPPSPQALASTMPFCYDTLEMSEWLQWIFLPGMQRILDQGFPLPDRCEIAPLAEVWFQERGLQQQAVRLLRLIGEIDRLITGSSY